MKTKTTFQLKAIALLLMPTLLLAQVAQNDATEYTKKANAQVLKDLPFSDKQDFSDAKKA